MSTQPRAPFKNDDDQKTSEHTKTHSDTPAATTHLSRPPKQVMTKSFETTMADATRTLPFKSRLFSRFIHLRIVSLLSDAAGGTAARPNALLFGAAFSFVLTLITYLVAKNLGYRLSGFESVGAFILGWLVGLTYDFLKLLITGKRS